MRLKIPTRGMLAVVLCLSWMVGFASATSVRSAASKASSLGSSDIAMLNELKELVAVLSQKVDDSDERIQSLEDKLSAQELTIKNLKSDVNDASSFHRYLQSADSDCLPKFRDTVFGPRCDFSYVMRFQNRTFFNDDVVFNENVEFDSDANCMPTYNSTSKMCTLNNNFTFDMGDITFNNSVTFNQTVEFDDDVEFTDSARFRDPVRFDSDVDFRDHGDVSFKKKVSFEEDVHMSNDDHNIEFRVYDKVTVRFYQDDEFKIDTDTTFYDHVLMKEDVVVEEKLRVHDKTYLQKVEVRDWMWIASSLEVEGAFYAYHRAIVKGGLHVQTGGLDVAHGADIRGGLQVTHDAKINGLLNVTNGIEVSGGLDADSAQIGVTSISRRLQSGNDAGKDTDKDPGVVLKVLGGVDANFLFADYIKNVIDLYVKSVTADSATVGGVSYNPPNVDIDINIDEIVNELKLYDGEVMIPNLKAIDFGVMSTMQYDGVDVADMTKISELTNMIKNEVSCSCGETEISPVMKEIVNEGYVEKLGFAKAEALQELVDKEKNLEVAMAAAMAIPEPVASSCQCGQSDIERVVTSDYLHSILRDLGFAKMDEISCDCDIDGMGFITYKDLTDMEFVTNANLTEMEFVTNAEVEDIVKRSAPQSSCDCDTAVTESISDLEGRITDLETKNDETKNDDLEEADEGLRD